MIEIFIEILLSVMVIVYGAFIFTFLYKGMFYIWGCFTRQIRYKHRHALIFIVMVTIIVLPFLLYKSETDILLDEEVLKDKYIEVTTKERSYEQFKQEDGQVEIEEKYETIVVPQAVVVEDSKKAGTYEEITYEEKKKSVFKPKEVVKYIIYK